MWIETLYFKYLLKNKSFIKYILAKKRKKMWAFKQILLFQEAIEEVTGVSFSFSVIDLSFTALKFILQCCFYFETYDNNIDSGSY